MNPTHQAVEIITIEASVAQCDGTGTRLAKGLGHPNVFLQMKNGRVRCPYCGRRFVRRRMTSTTETAGQ